MQIDKEYQKLGGRLDCKTLNEFNKQQVHDENANIYEEDFFSDNQSDDEMSQQQTKISKANKKLNRINTSKSIRSVKSAKSRKSTRTMKTNASRSSRGSNSGAAEKSKSFFYDRIFGKRVHSHIQVHHKNMAPITLNLKEFIQINWEMEFPTLIIDFI